MFDGVERWIELDMELWAHSSCFVVEYKRHLLAMLRRPAKVYSDPRSVVPLVEQLVLSQLAVKDEHRAPKREPVLSVNVDHRLVEDLLGRLVVLVLEVGRIVHGFVRHAQCVRP